MAVQSDNRDRFSPYCVEPLASTPRPFTYGYLALRAVAARRRHEGDLLGALAALRRAAGLAAMRRDHAWRGLLLSEMAALYHEEGAPQLAAPLFSEALSCLIRGQGLPDEAWTHACRSQLTELLADALSPPVYSPVARVPTGARRRPGQMYHRTDVPARARSAAARTRALAAATSSVLAISAAALADEPSLSAGPAPAALPPPVQAASPADPPSDALPAGIREECQLAGAAAPPALPPAPPSPSPAAPQAKPPADTLPAGIGEECQLAGARDGATSAPAPDSPPASAAPRADLPPGSQLPAPSSQPPADPPTAGSREPGAGSRPPAGHTRSLSVPRVTTPPVIDGRLDDACWKQASVATGFWVSETERAPSEATEAYVAADADTLYFAFRCHSKDPAAIFAQQTQRDADLGLDDMVTVQLDPYHNQRQIFQFTVNALGTQADVIAGGRAQKIEWKGEWKAAAVRTPDGWTAEIAIPFSMLNYDPGAGTFGVNFVRYDHRTQEWSRWADVTPAYRNEEMGRLTGLRPPAHSAPPVSLMTYTTGGVDEPNRTGHRRPFLASSGLDLRYNPTNNLTGMASLYPDFSQVENDVVGVGFSYNEKYVPDRRPFFQEGNGFFGDSRTYFYSSRVPDFDVGGKLFGRLGPMQVGFLGVSAPGGRQDYVARALRELGPRSSLSLMAVGTERSGLSNQLLDFQANTRSRKGYTASLDLAGTHSRGTPGDGALMGLSVGRETPHLQVGLTANRTGPRFFPGDGFIAGDQLGTIGGSAYASYNREYAGRGLRTIRGDLVYSNRDTLTGLLQNRNLTADVSVETRSQQELTLIYSAGPYRPRGTDLGQWSKTINQDRLLTASLFFNTRSSHGGYGLTYAWGRQGGGPYSDLAPSFWWKPSAKTSLSYSYEQAFSFGTTRQGVLSFSCDLNRQQSIGLRWIDYQGQGYWRVAFRRAVARGIDIYAVFNREPGISHRFVVKLVRSLR